MFAGGALSRCPSDVDCACDVNSRGPDDRDLTPIHRCVDRRAIADSFNHIAAHIGRRAATRMCRGMGSKIDFLSMARVLAARPMVDDAGRVTRYGRRVSDRLLDLTVARFEKGGQASAKVMEFSRKVTARGRE